MSTPLAGPAVLADTTAALRQVLVRGRVAEGVTDAPLTPTAATLTWRIGDAPAAPTGSLPVRLAAQPGGWFALHLVPGADMPDLAAAAAAAGVAAVTVIARLVVAGRDPVTVERDVPADELALTTVAVTVGGVALAARTVAGAAVDLEATVPPRPVGLRGVVLRSHDPAAPVAGATVAVDGGPTVPTDVGGRFVVDALPVAPTVDVTVTDGTETTTVHVRPDFGRPVQLLTVSLPG